MLAKKKTLLQLLLALHFSEPYGKELLIKTLEIFNDQIHKASFPAICSCDSQWSCSHFYVLRGRERWNLHGEPPGGTCSESPALKKLFRFGQTYLTSTTSLSPPIDFNEIFLIQVRHTDSQTSDLHPKEAYMWKSLELRALVHHVPPTICQPQFQADNPATSLCDVGLSHHKSAWSQIFSALLIFL